MELMAQNCRFSNPSLGKALNLSKDAIAYRLKRLEREGYLNRYVLFIDARRLGFTRYHLLIRLESGIEDKEKMREKMASHPYVMWFNSFIGRYDLQVIVDALDGFHLNTIREEIFRLCEHKVKEYIILTHLCDLEFTQLNPVLDLGTRIDKRVDASFSGMLTTRKFPVGMQFKKSLLSPTDLDILKNLADDPRRSLTDIGKSCGKDWQTVKSHIARMIRDKIILNFGGIPNLSKLGFVTYYMLVRITQNTSLEVLRKPFHELRNIFYAGRMIGDYDMILYLNARNPRELYESIELFKRDIGEHIIQYDILLQDKVYHWRQFTAGIRSVLGRNREGF